MTQRYAARHRKNSHSALPLAIVWANKWECVHCVCVCVCRDDYRRIVKRFKSFGEHVGGGWWVEGGVYECVGRGLFKLHLNSPPLFTWFLLHHAQSFTRFSADSCIN